MVLLPKQEELIFTGKSFLAALAADKQRFEIAQMFNDFKSEHYNLEETNVSQ